MPAPYAKFLVILLIFIGEATAIFAETVAAKKYATVSLSFLPIFFKMLLLIILASGFLVAGYMLGIRAFKNIWIVSVISITSILIVEPILNFTIFSQLPTKGALVGLVLGILGFLSAMFL